MRDHRLNESALKHAIQRSVERCVLLLKKAHRKLSEINTRPKPRFAGPLRMSVRKVSIVIVGPREYMAVADGLLEGIQ